MSRIAQRVRVTGLVQGVFFRAWTAERARALNVAGWVRNAPDGTVEGHLEGDGAAVQLLVELLHQGPPSAQVSEVEIRAGEPEGATSFEVRT